jgi:hypothetical protein
MWSEILTAASRLGCDPVEFLLKVLRHHQTTRRHIPESKYLGKKFWEEQIAYFPWYDTDRIENDASNNDSIVACVFVATVKFLTEPLPSNEREYTYRYTDWWEGFMKYAVEMGWGAMTYIPSFIKIDSGIQKLIGGKSQREWWSINLLLIV